MYSNHNPGKNDIDQIRRFILNSPGLELKGEKDEALKIHQKIDGKNLLIESRQVEEVLIRKDSEGHTFLQINFLGGKKILITETLIGFKPVGCVGLDSSKLPNVVTTPDLISVVEAIEESINQSDEFEDSKRKVETLHQVFNSVLYGGEAIGFDLSSEKEWVKRLISCKFKTSSV